MSVTRIKFVALALFTALSGCAHRAALEQGCRERLPNRCVELGEDLLRNREERSAETWFARGCELGSWDACVRHASFYEWGWGVEQSRSRARSLYDAACRMGLPEGCSARERIDALESVILCTPGDDARGFGEKFSEAKRLQVDALQICHGLTPEASLPVDVKVFLIVGPDGRASSATIAENSRPDLHVGECTRALLLKWRFPCPPEQKGLVLTFAFRP